jgi:hypothetical protein
MGDLRGGEESDCVPQEGPLWPCTWGAEPLDLASRIDAKVQRLMAEGADDIALFLEMSDDLPAFKRLLDWRAPHHGRVVPAVWRVLSLRKGP